MRRQFARLVEKEMVALRKWIAAETKSGGVKRMPTKPTQVMRQ